MGGQVGVVVLKVADGVVNAGGDGLAGAPGRQRDEATPLNRAGW
jgi:hypothetical protein